MAITKFNWQEPAAYTTAIIFAVIGLVAGYSKDPDWLGRAGSLVIVVGVLLAASRKMDLLHKEINKVIRENAPAASSSARDALLKKYGREPTASEIQSLTLKVLEEMTKDMSNVMDKRRHVFKLHEVALVVAGTLLNGFGPWLIGAARSAA